MIVEVFFIKRIAFIMYSDEQTSYHCIAFLFHFINIKSIERDGNNFILVTDKYMTDNENVILNTNEYELRVCY